MPVALGTISAGYIARDASNAVMFEVWEQNLQAIVVVILDSSIGKKVDHQLPELHLRPRLDGHVAAGSKFLLELLVNVFRPPPIGSARAFGVADAIDISVSPINVATLIKRH